MITVDEMVESGKCPCEVCSSQDESTLSLFSSKQVNKNSTNLVRIDAGLHRLLKIKAAAEKTTIRTLIEGCLAELLEIKNET